MRPPDQSRPGAIALVLPSLAGGGVERVMLTLAREFLSRGHQVHLVLARAEGELLELVPEGVRLVDLGCRRLRRVPLAFARYLRRESPGAVIASMWPLTSLCVLGHRLARSRSRITVSERVALSHAPRHAGRLRRAVLRGTLALSHRRADACIAISAGVAEDVSRLSGLERERVSVIHNPVELPTTPIDAGAAQIWSAGAAKRVLTVGRLVAQKNHLLLIEAFARLRETTEAELVILGEGPLRGELERRAAALGIGHAVSLPGFVLDPWPAYASADLFVLSSDYEGFGNVLLEALACGLPVVSTDCPSGPREILERGANAGAQDGTTGGAFGALVPCRDPAALADAMLRALAEPPDPERLRARAAEFTPAATAEAYLRVALGTDHTAMQHTAPC